MRKKVWTVILTTAILILLSVVEQISVGRLTDDALIRTQELLSLLAQNEMA